MPNTSSRATSWSKALSYLKLQGLVPEVVVVAEDGEVEVEVGLQMIGPIRTKTRLDKETTTANGVMIRRCRKLADRVDRDQLSKTSESGSMCYGLFLSCRFCCKYLCQNLTILRNHDICDDHLSCLWRSGPNCHETRSNFHPQLWQSDIVFGQWLWTTRGEINFSDYHHGFSARLHWGLPPHLMA